MIISKGPFYSLSPSDVKKGCVFKIWFYFNPISKQTFNLEDIASLIRPITQTYGFTEILCVEKDVPNEILGIQLSIEFEELDPDSNIARESYTRQLIINRYEPFIRGLIDILKNY